MSEEQKQAVADEPDVQSDETVSEGQGAPEKTESEDWDAILNEFKKTDEPSQPEQKAAAPEGGQTDSEKRLQALERQYAMDKEREALNKIIPDIRGDLPTDVFDDDMVEIWIRKRATQDKRIDDAWELKDSNPQAFARVVQSLGREFAKKYGKLSTKDESATADKEAVAHAVRGQAKPAPEGGDPSYKGMSDAEFRQDVKKRYGFNVPI